MSGNVTRTELRDRIDDLIGYELEQSDRVFDAELESWHPYVTDVIAHVTRFRGKRLRPILLLLSAKACGGSRPDHHVLAAVVEMIHTATLVHDDVLDESETRRHVATVNSRWNTETSVLCGDYLFTHAFHLAASLESTLACRMIGRATNLVCEGELCQVHERANCDLSEEQYFRIIDGKTAELCALSCVLGAHGADADLASTERMEQYGRSLGMAFQIADDLLDIVGSEQTTGKSLGTDYRKQKLTLPVIRLLSTADATSAVELRDCLAHPSADHHAEINRRLHDSHSLEYARAKANEFAVDARDQLSGLPESEARRILTDITDFVCRRSF